MHSFKLLGVCVDESLTWNCHNIEYIASKASKRLYFLKVLKRSGLPDEFLYCPILEYCSVVWGHNLSKKQSSQLESIQKRAIRIIHQATRQMPYDNLLYITVILHRYKTDDPNKQKAFSHQFWTKRDAYITSSRSNLTILSPLGCVRLPNSLCRSSGQINSSCF